MLTQTGQEGSLDPHQAKLYPNGAVIRDRCEHLGIDCVRVEEMVVRQDGAFNSHAPWLIKSESISDIASRCIDLEKQALGPMEWFIHDCPLLVIPILDSKRLEPSERAELAARQCLAIDHIFCEIECYHDDRGDAFKGWSDINLSWIVYLADHAERVSKVRKGEAQIAEIADTIALNFMIEFQSSLLDLYREGVATSADLARTQDTLLKLGQLWPEGGRILSKLIGALEVFSSEISTTLKYRELFVEEIERYVGSKFAQRSSDSIANDSIRQRENLAAGYRLVSAVNPIAELPEWSTPIEAIAEIFSKHRFTELYLHGEYSSVEEFAFEQAQNLLGGIVRECSNLPNFTIGMRNLDPLIFEGGLSPRETADALNQFIEDGSASAVRIALDLPGPAPQAVGRALNLAKSEPQARLEIFLEALSYLKAVIAPCKLTISSRDQIDLSLHTVFINAESVEEHSMNPPPRVRVFLTPSDRSPDDLETHKMLPFGLGGPRDLELKVRRYSASCIAEQHPGDVNGFVGFYRRALYEVASKAGFVQLGPLDEIPISFTACKTEKERPPEFEDESGGDINKPTSLDLVS